MAYFKHVCLVEAPQSMTPPIPRFISDAIGVCYLAAAIKNDVETLVMPDNYFNEGIFDSFRTMFKRYPVDLVGISSMTGGFNNAVKLARIARENGAFVVMGGFHPTSLPEEVLELGCVDAVVIGEGEETFRELVLKGPSKEVRGLAYIENGSVTFTGVRPVIGDVDSIPFPLRSFRPERFGEKGSNYSIDTIYTSRGCPWSCSFCANDLMHKSWRGRSAENVVEELALLHDPKKKKLIKIWDANFLTNIARAEKICDLMIEQGFTNFKFGSESRVKDLIRAEQILEKLHRIGLCQIGLGIESPNPRTLELMNKKNMLGDVERAIELAKKHKIKTEGYFIIGHHSETVDDTMAYPEYAKSLGIDKALFMVMTPYPGTKIFDEYKNAGNIVSYDWDLYNNFSPVIRTASMDVQTIVKMMAYCHFAFSSYHSVIRKNGARSILIDLLSRFLTLSLLMKTNKMLSEEEFIDAFYGALAMYSAKEPVIELERDDFTKKKWKSPMVISIEHSPGKAVDIMLDQEGTKRMMRFTERKDERTAPNAVIRLKDLVAYAKSVSVDRINSILCSGEIIKNNPDLLLSSMTFIRQHLLTLSDLELWRFFGSTSSLYTSFLKPERSNIMAISPKTVRQNS